MELRKQPPTHTYETNILVEGSQGEFTQVDYPPGEMKPIVGGVFVSCLLDDA